ncbi:MAG: DUF3131 domain-containing protein [Pseudomonadota bacterium]
MKVRHLAVPTAQLTAAAGVVMYLQSSPIFSASQGEAWEDFAGYREVEPRKPAPLQPVDLQVAQAAWAYFESSTHPSGLVNPVGSFSNSTLWDQASYGLGVVAAEALGLIDRDTAVERIEAYLDALALWPQTELGPPVTYANVETLEPTDLDGTVTPGGIGWSALDIGRSIVAMQAMARLAPELMPKVMAIQGAWELDQVVRDGELWGGRYREDGSLEPVQEGRLGYEEYAARAFALLGYDTTAAADMRATLSVVSLGGVEVAADTRTLYSHGASNHVVSEPYLLHAFEFGLDAPNKRLAVQVYLAQEARYRATGTVTAMSEGNLNQEPYFVYNALHADGANWMPVAPDGTQHPQARTLSTKAAIGWSSLYASEYGDLLYGQARALSSDTGFHAGRYEASGEVNDVRSANTNGVILEAMHFRAKGSFLKTW